MSFTAEDYLNPLSQVGASRMLYVSFSQKGLHADNRSTAPQVNVLVQNISFVTRTAGFPFTLL